MSQHFRIKHCKCYQNLCTVSICTLFKFQYQDLFSTVTNRPERKVTPGSQKQELGDPPPQRAMPQSQKFFSCSEHVVLVEPKFRLRRSCYYEILPAGASSLDRFKRNLKVCRLRKLAVLRIFCPSPHPNPKSAMLEWANSSWTCYPCKVNCCAHKEGSQLR